MTIDARATPLHLAAAAYVLLTAGTVDNDRT